MLLWLQANITVMSIFDIFEESDFSIDPTSGYDEKIDEIHSERVE